jgi:hypothetical protein
MGTREHHKREGYVKGKLTRMILCDMFTKLTDIRFLRNVIGPWRPSEIYHWEILRDKH